MLAAGHRERGLYSPCSKKHDISLIDEHIPNIAVLAADLNKAVQAGWSRRHDLRYKKVEALLLRWEDDDLGVETELKGLQHVLEDFYHYHVQTYHIPSQKPDKALTRRVLEFLSDDSVDTLYVVYYAGHARTTIPGNKAPTWYA